MKDERDSSTFASFSTMCSLSSVRCSYRSDSQVTSIDSYYHFTSKTDLSISSIAPILRDQLWYSCALWRRNHAESVHVCHYCSNAHIRSQCVQRKWDIFNNHSTLTFLTRTSFQQPHLNLIRQAMRSERSSRSRGDCDYLHSMLFWRVEKDEKQENSTLLELSRQHLEPCGIVSTSWNVNMPLRPILTRYTINVSGHVWKYSAKTDSFSPRCTSSRKERLSVCPRALH